MCAYAVYTTYVASSVVIALGVVSLVSSLLEIFIDAAFPPERLYTERLPFDSRESSPTNSDIEMQTGTPRYTLNVTGTEYPQTARRVKSATNLSTMFNSH
jgi:hypothetical protein